MIGVQMIQTVRCELEHTKDISEKEIRALCGGVVGHGLFIRDLWENDLITFNGRSYRKNCTINVEIPTKAEHYEMPGGRQWLTPEAVTDHVMSAIHNLQTAIVDYNKMKEYMAIMEKAKGE